MAAAGEIFRSNLTELLEESHSGDDELHVLAVDDSLVDRKVIERLLKISSCKVTVVESARRALQYLGLDGDGENSDIGFDESSVFREIPVVIMSSENVLTRIDRCLEEGAEDFLLKPVKLSDVRRLKDFIMRGEVKDGEKSSLKRRRSSDDCTPSLSTTFSPMRHLCDPPSSVFSPLSPSTLSSKKSRL
ncbi:hypothetical protein TSUD_209490 [Trifolium subterraneum]|uniref:Response regulatory domain-containing protein n=1 Tax=Trifolium subterraneum TaxID=3900 RepID=A0A2Z6NP18_TRISU|nr:hypothetical protein TSUD_209490 [Trifolium subterraneum]